MYIHHRNVRALFQYLNVKLERKFNSTLPVIARLRQKLQLIRVIDQATCEKKNPGVYLLQKQKIMRLLFFWFFFVFVCFLSF